MKIKNLIIIVLILLNFCYVEGSNSTRTYIEAVQSSIVENEYILTFKHYMQHSKVKDILVDMLGETGWELIERDNPSKNYPTDFALVKFPDGDTERALSILSQSEIVKHVFPQRCYVGVLKEAEVDVSNNFWAPKPVGKFHSTFPEYEAESEATFRRRKLNDETSVPEMFNSQYLWEKGYTGAGVKVAIFDTGLRKDHPHFKNIVLSNDWTDEGTNDDLLGHGTFVAGVVASSEECLGFASDAEIYSFRVFTTKKVSYTTWFLDAFNHAIHLGINILNLSIGGPDFNDLPFVEKVWEMSANNIIVVSAIGNDGPTYGTLNNPADQLDVIGVGGITFKNRLAKFSSRGMTTWELPSGYGRVKPDILAYSQGVRGSTPDADCKVLSGTSVASPVVAGAITLLASTLPEHLRWQIINPASMKQVLIEGALRLPNAHIFEQGHGKMDLIESYALLQNYVPRVSFSPSELDLTSTFMWPYSSQPLYYSSMPVIVNVTVLNGMGVTGLIVGEPTWIPGENGHLLEISFTYPELMWPWTGYLAIHFRVHESASKWRGIVEGIVRTTIQSPPGPGETQMRSSTVDIPVKVSVIPTPPRAKRILWDQYHNLRYPSGYFPRDILKMTKEPFDWNGDHIHTNFRELYDVLRDAGYFVEVLGHPYTCFNASNYGVLLIVDPEEEYFEDEIEKLRIDIEKEGLSIVVVGDWYNAEVNQKIKFFDENTKQWWTPVTGGSNIPALNDVLKPYKMAFGDKIYDGKITMDNKNTYFASGAGIGAFPKGGILIPFELQDQSAEIIDGTKDTHKVPVLGLFQVPGLIEPSQNQSLEFDKSPGRIVMFGDSSCLDSANKQVNSPCFWLLKEILMFTNQGIISEIFQDYPPLSSDYLSQRLNLPERLEGNKIATYSKVIGKKAFCENLLFKNTSITESKIVVEWKEPKRASLSGMFITKSLFKPRSKKSTSFWSIIKLPAILLLIAFTILLVIWFKKRSINRERANNV